jgi:hypothetical protein
MRMRGLEPPRSYLHTDLNRIMAVERPPAASKLRGFVEGLDAMAGDRGGDPRDGRRGRRVRSEPAFAEPACSRRAAREIRSPRTSRSPSARAGADEPRPPSGVIAAEGDAAKRFVRTASVSLNDAVSEGCQRIASAFAVEPMPPRMCSGAHVTRNSKRFCAAHSAASASSSQSSPSGMPSRTNRSTCRK